MPSYYELFSAALLQYEKQGISLDTTKAFPMLVNLFTGRYESLLPDIRHDILAASILPELPAQCTDPKAVRFRAQVLERLAHDVAFIQTATRPMNIVIAARKKAIDFGEDDPLRRLEHAGLESKEGLELYQLLGDIAGPLHEASSGRDVEGVIRLLKSLEAPINTFFEATMVMVDEPEVRYARLTLMHACALALLAAGDFTKLVIEGVA